MLIIQASTSNNGVQVPSQPFPTDALRVVFDGQQYLVYQPGDALPLESKQSAVPQEVTMRQARLALNAIGKLSAVDAAIAAMPEPTKTQAQITWEFSSMVQRSQPLVLSLGSALGLSSADIDQLFVTADTL